LLAISDFGDEGDFIVRIDHRLAACVSAHAQERLVIETVGDAASYFGTLTKEKHGHSHGQIAVRMLNHVLDQPTYLKTATMSLQAALLMEGLLASPLAVGGD
jgi:hypothetical protein